MIGLCFHITNIESIFHRLELNVAYNYEKIELCNKAPDNQIYVPLTSHSSSSSSVFSLPSALYVVADPGYDDKKLYEYSKKTLGMDLVCPIERYENTSKNRFELVCFYQSTLGQAVYSRRRISIEPLIEHLK